MNHFIREFRSLLFAAALLIIAEPASAIVTVGPAGSGCRFTKIQDAINLVLNNERFHPDDTDPFIGVSGDNFYNEALVIDGSNVTNYIDPFGLQEAFVQIFGNYDQNCNDVPVNTTATVGAGGGKAGNSVLEIRGSHNVHVVLNHLILSQATGVASGGAINFHGSGVLDLSNVEISFNDANFGAGIRASGQAPGISLFLHSGTLIHDNFANHAGGGIRIEGETHLFALEDQTWLLHNHANVNDGGDGTGGALQLLGSEAVADIGSPGIFGFAVIFDNDARLGGGVAVQQGATLRLFSSTDTTNPARIEFNDATVAGGGIYVEGGHLGGAFGDSINGSAVCGFGYGINFNSAANGAAIYVGTGDHERGGFVGLTQSNLIDTHCGTGAVLPAVAPCAFGVCNSIRGNEATQDSGAIILIDSNGSFDADQVEVRGNQAGRALWIFGGSNAQLLRNCAIVGNTLRHELVRTENAGISAMSNCTLAGNTLDPQAPVFSMSGFLGLRQSIVWQPQATVSSNSLAVSDFVDVITGDADFFDAAAFRTFSNVHAFAPGFLDPANGDYQLKPSSLAIDYASTGSGIDLNSAHRATALLPYAHNTPFDIGAYERQNLGDQIFANGVDRSYQ